MLIDIRGFTLAEVMVSLFMTVVVAGSTYHLLITTQRLTRLQGARTSVQSGVRAGSQVIREELGQLSTVEGGTAAQNDIVAFSPSAVTYRAMRGTGFICQSSSVATIQLARSSFSGHRDPQAGRDEAYVFVPGNPELDAKDSWVPAQIVSVATAAPCPGSLGPGITLTVSPGAPLGVPEPGTPVRITELMELKVYQADRLSWLGARSVSTGEAIQPLVGPLTDAGGLQLEYLDATGAPTADPTRIQSIRSTLKMTTNSSEIGSATPVEEELITQVTLRAPPRP
jgi:hypothetical protein